MKLPDLLEIPLASIEVGSDRARDLDPGHAQALADSIQMQGLLYPVLVREMGAGGYRLVDGHQRLEAFRLLGRDAIPVILSAAASDDAAMLDQVMANLARRMVALDFCRHLFMLKQAWLRLFPAAARGGNKNVIKGQTKLQNLEFGEVEADAPSFPEAMAEKFGLSKAAIFDAVAIWTNLSPTSRQRLHCTALAEKKTELKTLSAESPARQTKILDLILGEDHPGVQNVAGALAYLEGGVQPTGDEMRLQVLRKSVAALPDPVFDRLIAENADRTIDALKRLGRI